MGKTIKTYNSLEELIESSKRKTNYEEENDIPLKGQPELLLEGEGIKCYRIEKDDDSYSFFILFRCNKENDLWSFWMPLDEQAEILCSDGFRGVWNEKIKKYNAVHRKQKISDNGFKTAWLNK